MWLMADTLGRTSWAFSGGAQPHMLARVGMLNMFAVLHMFAMVMLAVQHGGCLFWLCCEWL